MLDFNLLVENGANEWREKRQSLSIPKLLDQDCHLIQQFHLVTQLSPLLRHQQLLAKVNKSKKLKLKYKTVEILSLILTYGASANKKMRLKNRFLSQTTTDGGVIKILFNFIIYEQSQKNEVGSTIPIIFKIAFINNSNILLTERFMFDYLSGV